MLKWQYSVYTELTKNIINFTLLNIFNMATTFLNYVCDLQYISVGQEFTKPLAVVPYVYMYVFVYSFSLHV